jgi:hypothetical protein
MMNRSLETDRLPEPYTPTPDGFERRLRAWVHLPTDDGTTSERGDTSAPAPEPGARDQAGGIARLRHGQRRRRGGRSGA